MFRTKDTLRRNINPFGKIIKTIPYVIPDGKVPVEVNVSQDCDYMQCLYGMDFCETYSIHEELYERNNGYYLTLFLQRGACINIVNNTIYFQTVNAKNRIYPIVFKVTSSKNIYVAGSSIRDCITIATDIEPMGLSVGFWLSGSVRVTYLMEVFIDWKFKTQVETFICNSGYVRMDGMKGVAIIAGDINSITIDYGEIKGLQAIKGSVNIGMSASELQAMDIGDAEEANITLDDAQKLRYVRTKADDQELAEIIADAIQRSDTGGIVQTNTADPYYPIIADAAEKAYWKVEEL